jgi:phosphoribosylanthranilate isomerase
MPVEVKICGLDRAETVDAAIEFGAAYTGFVFYPPSPRNLTPADASDLTARVPSNVTRVALFVDPSDDDIAAVLDLNQIDLLQLHGAESAERIAAIKSITGLAAMKVVKLAGADDLAASQEYLNTADHLLFDAKPPAEMTNALPGGNALAFDWKLLRNAEIALPWMLAGGLTPENIAEAVAISGAKAIDVSSGVENAPGVKSVEKIKAFLTAVQGL